MSRETGVLAVDVVDSEGRRWAKGTRVEVAMPGPFLVGISPIDETGAKISERPGWWFYTYADAVREEKEERDEAG